MCITMQNTVCSADILCLLIFLCKLYFSCFSPAKLQNFSSSQNLGAAESTEADKTKPGLHARSWLCYYEVLRKIQTKEKAICNRVGCLLAIPRMWHCVGFFVDLIFGRLVTGRSGDV